MKERSKTLSSIFIAASVVGGAHYGITGFENEINSFGVGLAAGFGALVMDIVNNVRASNSAGAPRNPASSSEPSPR